MSAARVIDSARASTCWCVRFADREKNFRRKAHAIAFCRRQTGDTRIKSVIRKRGRGAYTYYGPGKDEVVFKADIDRLSFAAVRARAPKPLFADTEVAS